MGNGWGLCLPHGPLGPGEAGRGLGLGPEVGWPRALRGKRGRGGNFLAGFSFICTASQSTQQFAARHPWKKPFSVEVNGPAQINGSAWVSLCVNKSLEAH